MGASEPHRDDVPPVGPPSDLRRLLLPIALAAALGLTTLLASCTGGFEQYFGPFDYFRCACTCVEMDCLFGCDRSGR